MKALAVVAIVLLVVLAGCSPRRDAQAPTASAQPPLNLKIVATDGNRVITSKQLIDELSTYQIVCVGETHTSEVHHRLQLQIIQDLAARGGRLGIGMEMFQRPFQGDVDAYIAGKTSEADFLKATQYDQRWGFDWKLYKPIADYAHANQTPLAALNASAELTHRIMQVGYDGLTADEKKELGPVDFNVKAHRDYWYNLIPLMHGTQKISPVQQERTYEVMTVWDDYMAQSAAAFLRDRHLDRIVILAGAGHIDGGFGIPDRAAGYAHTKRATVKIVLGDETSGADDGLSTDYVIYVLP